MLTGRQPAVARGSDVGGELGVEDGAEGEPGVPVVGFELFLVLPGGEFGERAVARERFAPMRVIQGRWVAAPPADTPHLLRATYTSDPPPGLGVAEPSGRESSPVRPVAGAPWWSAFENRHGAVIDVEFVADLPDSAGRQAIVASIDPTSDPGEIG